MNTLLQSLKLYADLFSAVQLLQPLSYWMCWLISKYFVKISTITWQLHGNLFFRLQLLTVSP